MRHVGLGETVDPRREFGTGLRAYLERARETARQRERRELQWSDEACRLAELAAGGAPRAANPPAPALDLVAV